MPNDIIKLAQDREEARKKGDFKKADDIRNQIEAKGYMLEDHPTGFKIRAASSFRGAQQ